MIGAFNKRNSTIVRHARIRRGGYGRGGPTIASGSAALDERC